MALSAGHLPCVALQRAGRSTLEGLYGWPLKPFDRAHPVRGVFNDPRIAGSSRSFHFGIDISAPNGTPVYAVRAGEVHLEGGRSLAVVAGDTAFGYWHIVPAVAHRQRVEQHQLLGHVEAPWLHLAFRRAPSRLVPRPAPARRAFTLDGHDAAARDEDRPLAQRTHASCRCDLRRGRRDRRGAPDPGDSCSSALGSASRHPRPAALARAARQPHGTPLAHTDRPLERPPPAGPIQLDLCARHHAEPARQARPLPLLSRPHLEHPDAPRRELPAGGRGFRPLRQPRHARRCPSHSSTTSRPETPPKRHRDVDVGSRARCAELPTRRAPASSTPRERWVCVSWAGRGRDETSAPIQARSCHDFEGVVGRVDVNSWRMRVALEQGGNDGCGVCALRGEPVLPWLARLAPRPARPPRGAARPEGSPTAVPHPRARARDSRPSVGIARSG